MAGRWLTTVGVDGGEEVLETGEGDRIVGLWPSPGLVSGRRHAPCGRGRPMGIIAFIHGEQIVPLVRRRSRPTVDPARLSDR